MKKTHEIVKERREQLGLSQDELARRVGYTNRSSIARIERGDTDIPQSKLYDIARALRVTPSYLMGEDTGTYIEEDGLPRLIAEMQAVDEEAMEKYFELTPQNREIVLGLIDTLLQAQTRKESKDD